MMTLEDLDESDRDLPLCREIEEYHEEIQLPVPGLEPSTF
jgi:hypothetical protein